MDEKDLKQIHDLMKKATDSRHYEIAANLRDARNKLYKITAQEYGKKVIEEVFKKD